MTTSTTITYQAAQARADDLLRAAQDSRRARRPGRIRSTGPARHRALARRLRLA
jgi:hypothetical protein